MAGWGLLLPYPEQPSLTDESPSVLARNALVVSFAALVAYSFEVTGHQPFILTGKIVEGLPPVQVPPFSVTTANRTVSFTEMAQVGRNGEPRPQWPLGLVQYPQCICLVTGSSELSWATEASGQGVWASGCRDRQGRVADREQPEGAPRRAQGCPCRCGRWCGRNLLSCPLVRSACGSSRPCSRTVSARSAGRG